MSEQVRDALADAASTVGGVRCSAYYRQKANPGDAMVRYGGTQNPGFYNGVVTWQVVVVLHTDLVKAEKFIEQVETPLVKALAEHMSVTSTQPIQLPAGQSGTIPALMVEGVRETEE